MIVRLHIETDSRLRLAWLTAINAVAVANDGPSHTLVCRIARLQAQKALELYFEEVGSPALNQMIDGKVPARMAVRGIVVDIVEEVIRLMPIASSVRRIVQALSFYLSR